jgi:hypothetical protein
MVRNIGNTVGNRNIGNKVGNRNTVGNILGTLGTQLETGTLGTLGTSVGKIGNTAAIQINGAVMHPSVGRNWSTWHFVKVLQQKDPIIFEKLFRSTVESWIDRMGSKPQWTEATLRRAENGNHPGHNHGGHKGAMVSCLLALRPT